MIFILLVHLLLYDVHFELLILVVLGCVRFHVFLFLQGIVTIWSDLGAQEADDAVDASVVPQARSILWSRLRQFVYQVLSLHSVSANASPNFLYSLAVPLAAEEMPRSDV